MEFLTEYGLFLLKTVTLVLAFLFAVGNLLALGKKLKTKIEVKSLTEDYQHLQRHMAHKTKHQKPAKKKEMKRLKQQAKHKPSLFVIDFDGDIKASEVKQLRKCITAVLSVATQQDEVLIRLESPGGSVNGYGLAASQLQRIRDRHIPLTVAIDKVAASGGYLMACVANRIIAAPFAIIGSIGVVAQLPNFHRWLKQHNIDIEMLTAGEFKRTLTMLGENSDKGRKKFQADLELIHTAFRDYVLTNRPQLDIDEVATGEHWLACDAFKLRLVDTLKTSDDYLIEHIESFNVFKISMHAKPSIINKLFKPAAKLLDPWA